MRNKLVPKRDAEACADCAAARAGDHALFYANCDGCVARALAGSPIAFAVGRGEAGAVDSLKRSVLAEFPREHFVDALARVRSWFEVLKARKGAK